MNVDAEAVSGEASMDPQNGRRRTREPVANKRDRIVELLLAGVTYRKIAATLHCSISTVTEVARGLETEVSTEQSRSKPEKMMRYLIATKQLQYRCMNCGGTKWQGEPMPLILDKAGDEWRVLCPNCQALLQAVA